METLTIPFADVAIFSLVEQTKFFDLWDEVIIRRALHHHNGRYNPRKRSLVHNIRSLLDKEHIAVLSKMRYDTKREGLNTSKTLSAVFGGNYSPRTTLYWNDFSEVQRKQLKRIFYDIQPKLEECLGRRIKLGYSDFKFSILRYEGASAKFDWHYDTEESNCFRILAMFRAGGKVPPFTYINNTNDTKERIDVHMNVGDAVLLRGTTTYHCVEASDDPNTVRYMLGIQIRTLDKVKIHKSLCSELRTQTPAYIMSSIVIPTVIKTLFVSSIVDFILTTCHIKQNHHFEAVASLGMIVASYLLSGKMPTGIGTNVEYSIRSIALLYGYAFLGTFNPHRALNLTAYVLGTELLMPSEYVAY
jgi:hypothetical protein